jgi:ADP-heptose:LPS heptosyltransferase
MKVGIFLSYIGLGSNIMHLAYCHEIAKKYGPVTVITICKNFKEAVNNDPNIKEVIYLDKYYKKLSDIFRLSKELSKCDLDTIFIFYPSLRFYLASKLAKIKNINSYPFFIKKNLHLVNTAKKFVEKKLNIKVCPTETIFYVNPEDKKNAEKKMDKSVKNIVVGAGSSGPTTKWGERNYIDLLKRLNNHGKFYFYIQCGPEESIISDTIIKEVGENKCETLSNKKIKDLIPIVSNCDLYIGNDSFGHHITSQCGIPSLILLLDTPRAYTDYSINQYQILPNEVNINKISHDVAISPDRIKVDDVFNKIISIIN